MKYAVLFSDNTTAVDVQSFITSKLFSFYYSSTVYMIQENEGISFYRPIPFAKSKRNLLKIENRSRQEDLLRNSFFPDFFQVMYI